jgi:hypothetical protein
MVCFSLTTARLSNWPLIVGSAPKPSIRRLLIVEQWSVDPWRLAPRTISWSFLLISLEIIYTKVKYLAGKWKSREIGVPRRNDLDVFGFGWLIKFKRAERFVFLRAQLCSNRSKFSAEREGLCLLLYLILDQCFMKNHKTNSWNGLKERTYCCDEVQI